MHVRVLGELSRRKGYENDDVGKTHVSETRMSLWTVGLSGVVWLFEIGMLMRKRRWSEWI